MTRSRATAKKAGTDWETEICAGLVRHGWIHAERRRLGGRYDKGDISGIPGIVIEAKNTPKMNLAGALDEAIVERENAKAIHGVAWLKRRGKTAAEAGYVVMDGETFMRLLSEAGY